MNCGSSEIIDTIAAVAALLFAISEAIIKFHGKDAERRVLFYAKYLYICQQLEIGVLAVSKLLKIAEGNEISVEELGGFAEAHMVPDDVFRCIFDYQELAFICLKSRNNEYIKLALDFVALAMSSAESINAFFQSIRQNKLEVSDSKALIDNLRSPRLKWKHYEMNATLHKLKNIGDSSECTLYSCEKRLSKIMYSTCQKRRRLGVFIRRIYVSLCISLLFLCVFYIAYLHFGLNFP